MPTKATLMVHPVKPSRWLQAVRGVVTATALSVAVFHPSVALASLFGMLGFGFPHPALIDPSTGAFTLLGSATFPRGYYAPVYDPLQNAFYLTAEPVDGSNGTSPVLERIDATTGAESHVVLPNGFDVVGLEFGATAASSVPEPPTALLLLAAVLGVGFVARRRRSVWT